MSQNFIRDGSGKVIGTRPGSEGGSSGGGGGSSSGDGGGGGGGSDENMFHIGTEKNVQQGINAAFVGGGAGIATSVLGIRGLPESFQGFALESTMRGMSLKGVLSSLSLAKPRQAVQGRNAPR